MKFAGKKARRVRGEPSVTRMNELQSSWIELTAVQGVALESRLVRPGRLDVEILRSHVPLWLDDAALGRHTPVLGQFDRLETMVEFTLDRHSGVVPLGGGPLPRRSLNRIFPALKSDTSIDFKSHCQEVTACVEQGSVPWRSSSRTERTEATHG